MQVDNVDFPGQQDPGILDPIWKSIGARDPLGSAWGTNGLIRFPNADYWGWNPAQHQASMVTVPALVLIGLLDGTLPGGWQTAVQIYDDLGSEKKVLVKVDGGSHLMVWEGSTSPTWKGPHATLQDAVVQWITSETYQGSTNGTFRVHGDGSIEQEGGRVPDVAAVVSLALSPNRASFSRPTTASLPTVSTLLNQEMALVDHLFASHDPGEADFALCQTRHNAQGESDSWAPNVVGNEDLVVSPCGLDLLESRSGR
jgi:hypothetical protein